MKRYKKIFLALLIVLIAIQFIRPARNENGQVLPSDITHVYAIPENLKTILRNSCYDCHSNSTYYPWYVNIQPIAWMMARHIRHGKKDLNFGEFGDYSKRRQTSKLKGIADQVENNDMPLSSYKLMHRNARLSQAEKKLIVDWMRKTVDSLSSEN